MKAACIGLVLVLAASGCQQKTSLAEKQSNDRPNGEDSVTTGHIDEVSQQEKRGWISDS